MVEVVNYVQSDGTSPFTRWFDKLKPTAANRVTTAVNRMEEGNFGDHKSIGEGVMERRIDHGPGYRIYFGRDGETLVILLGGGTKSRQQADIERAKAAWSDYKASKKKGS